MTLKFTQLVAAVLLISNFALAQAPQGIPYQAAARNASGDLITNQNISIRFTIHDNTATGTSVYQETHSVTTNALGLFSLNVGEGAPVSGTLSGVDWGSGAKFLEVELDPAGGASYTSMGTSQMMSVPYALFAAGSGDLPDGTAAGNTLYWNGSQWVADSNIHNNGGDVGIGTTSPNAKLSVRDSVANAGVMTVENVHDDGFAGTYFRNSAGIQGYVGHVGTGGWCENNSFQIGSFGEDFKILAGSCDARLTILGADGRVGIGTSNPSFQLHVRSPNTSGYAGVVKLEAPNMNSGSQTVFMHGKNAGTRNQAEMRFHYVGNGSTANAYQFGFSNIQPFVFFTGNERVGIGTGGSAPTQKLDVNGQIRIRGGSPGAGKVLTSSADGTGSWTAASALSITEVDPQVSVSATNGVPKWNGTTLVNGSIYDVSGKIGIGTSAPQYLLDVNGEASIGGPNTVTGLRSVALGRDNTVSGYGSVAGGRWATATANHTTAFGYEVNATSGQAVALGWSNTSSGLGSFTVGRDNVASGNYASAIGYFNNAAGINAFALGYRAKSLHDGSFVWADNTNTDFSSTASKQFLIRASGGVGIGTNSPSTALDVNGQVRIRGGAPGAGKVLTSDATGTATWQTPASAGLPPGTMAGEMLYWDGTTWASVAPGTHGQSLYFCNGVPTWGPCPVPLAIGDSHGGGIVAYILQPGDAGYDPLVQHGLIAAAADQGTAQWGCFGTAISGADGSAIGTGQQNTTDIINGCASAGIAARVCDNLVLNGYSDWYLPSQFELAQLYANKAVIGGFASGIFDFYWSSTEAGGGNATTDGIIIRFSDGFQGLGTKTGTHHIRAIRSF